MCSIIAINHILQEVKFANLYSICISTVACIRRKIGGRISLEFFTTDDIGKDKDLYTKDILKLLEELNNDEKVEGI